MSSLNIEFFVPISIVVWIVVEIEVSALSVVSSLKLARKIALSNLIKSSQACEIKKTLPINDKICYGMHTLYATCNKALLKINLLGIG